VGETTKIEWADATTNFWWGCTKVSPACANCYAETLAKRWDKDVWGLGKPREDHRAGARKLAMRLQRQAVRERRRLRVFCASMADWLDPEVPAEWLADMLAVVAATPGLDWLLLTKRPRLWRERMEAALRMAGADEMPGLDEDGVPCQAAPWVSLATSWLGGQPPANVWVGCTAEDQRRADERIPDLLAIPARVRFLSCEPLLGPVDLTRIGAAERGDDVDALRGHVTRYHGHKARNASECSIGVETACYADAPRVHWVIAGGESGHGARPMHPAWARSLRDQAQAAGVAFHFKQWGEWAAGEPRGMRPVEELAFFPAKCDCDDGPHTHVRDAAGFACLKRLGKGAAGRLLDGREWSEVPRG
jgi:protein gp37